MKSPVIVAGILALVFTISVPGVTEAKKVCLDDNNEELDLLTAITKHIRRNCKSSNPDDDCEGEVLDPKAEFDFQTACDEVKEQLKGAACHSDESVYDSLLAIDRKKWSGAKNKNVNGNNGGGGGSKKGPNKGGSDDKPKKKRPGNSAKAKKSGGANNDDEDDSRKKSDRRPPRPPRRPNSDDSSDRGDRKKQKPPAAKKDPNPDSGSGTSGSGSGSGSGRERRPPPSSSGPRKGAGDQETRPGVKKRRGPRPTVPMNQKAPVRKPEGPGAPLGLKAKKTKYVRMVQACMAKAKNAVMPFCESMGLHRLTKEELSDPKAKSMIERKAVKKAMKAESKRIRPPIRSGRFPGKN